MAIVLVVEDDEQVRVLAESALQDAGHTVLAATGTEGAQAVLNKNQSIDVMFIDLVLGGDIEAGLKVAQHARVSRPKLAVLYTTGAAVNAGMQALFTEPYHFLPKPYTIEQLTKSVAYLLLKVNPRPRIEFPQMPT
jgi:DNA-binding NtrC family response regulator